MLDHLTGTLVIVAFSFAPSPAAKQVDGFMHRPPLLARRGWVCWTVRRTTSTDSWRDCHCETADGWAPELSPTPSWGFRVSLGNLCRGLMGWRPALLGSPKRLGSVGVGLLERTAWGHRLRDEYIDLIADVPPIAADFPQRPSRQPWPIFGHDRLARIRTSFPRCSGWTTRGFARWRSRDKSMCSRLAPRRCLTL
jgi:hypothetical protein